MTKIQELRHRVVLFKRQIKEEVDGSFTESWTSGDAVWAKIVPYAGREAQGEGWHAVTEGGQAKYKVTIRYRRAPFHRLQWEDAALALLCAPIIDERRQWVTCLMYMV